MSPSLFPNFSLLPFELRSQIWAHSMPSTTTLHIREGADLEVTSISPPPGQALATKEAREAYLSAGFKPHSILTTEDWEEIHISEDTTIQLIISPSENSRANLNITWTELEVLLYEALPVVKNLHIVCSKPERLVRLWMTPEGGLVRVGQTHNDETLWPAETVSSDAKYRESLHPSLAVTTSAASLEEIAQGSAEEVQTWELVEEKVLSGFGPKATISTTKAFKLVGAEEEEVAVERWEEMREEEVRSQGVELTEEVMEKFLQQTGWEAKPVTPSSTYSGDVVYRDGAWLTVA